MKKLSVTSYYSDRARCDPDREEAESQESVKYGYDLGYVLPQKRLI